MTTKRTILISQEGIATAEQESSSHCVIAEAIKQQIPGVKQVAVDLATIRWTEPDKGKRYIFLTPRIAQIALMNFDLGHHIQPFELELRPAQIFNARRPKEPNSPRKKREAVQLKSPSTGAVPVIHGGKAPPEGVLSSRGKARKFGLKTLAKTWNLAADQQGPVEI